MLFFLSFLISKGSKGFVFRHLLIQIYYNLNNIPIVLTIVEKMNDFEKKDFM